MLDSNQFGRSKELKTAPKFDAGQPVSVNVIVVWWFIMVINLILLGFCIGFLGGMSYGIGIKMSKQSDQDCNNTENSPDN
jgi:hypothetical protein